jgi:CRP-like cAMP-binding protein
MSDVRNRAIFGELSLIFESKRTASVKTSETSDVLVIPESAFN